MANIRSSEGAVSGGLNVSAGDIFLASPLEYPECSVPQPESLSSSRSSPWLTWLLGFKSYDHREWVNVSRHKFEGLIGRDLIWCLYCDWMTGVYSLGAEMLRNVESFWCPIRFYDDKKCENCSLDFPDIDAGWVPADGTMADVVQVLETEIDKNPTWSWFGDRNPLQAKTVFSPINEDSDPQP